ncbi:MAG: phosphoribosylamine--glycine ligase [Gammaproteobacteria bacterium]|nr:phosphoribosylamine--glycine ligase [Gammaproteobacteria bacterium]
MNVLVIGGGGREHALAWKLAQSPRAERVYVAPGNAGTAGEPKVENIDIDATDVPGLVAFARREAIGLTIVGPEAPLVGGIADSFAGYGLPCFGPNQAAARLEGSKAYAKAFLERHGIPTAGYRSFESLLDAEDYLRSIAMPIVIKADGLAAGKGVTVAQTRGEALDAVRDCLAESRFGDAGRRVVIEECLTGEEVSFICMVAGRQVLPLASSQDHKARDDGDRGPNTGGMGAYSPSPVVDASMHGRIMKEVIEPTVRGLQAEGMYYLGFLYAGLMITDDGTPKVLEYNCRCGDPETQPIIMRLESDLLALCEAAVDGRLDAADVQWRPEAAIGVVMAAGGYPGEYDKGHAIRGLDAAESRDVKVFHAGTRQQGGEIATDGGRVLCVTALGGTVKEARARAYRAVDAIHWTDAFYRRDIGSRAVDRERWPAGDNPR